MMKSRHDVEMIWFQLLCWRYAMAGVKPCKSHHDLSSFYKSPVLLPSLPPLSMLLYWVVQRDEALWRANLRLKPNFPSLGDSFFHRWKPCKWCKLFFFMGFPNEVGEVEWHQFWCVSISGREAYRINMNKTSHSQGIALQNHLMRPCDQKL